MSYPGFLRPLLWPGCRRAAAPTQRQAMGHPGRVLGPSDLLRVSVMRGQCPRLTQPGMCSGCCCPGVTASTRRDSVSPLPRYTTACTRAIGPCVPPRGSGDMVLIKHTGGPQRSPIPGAAPRRVCLSLSQCSAFSAYLPGTGGHRWGGTVAPGQRTPAGVTHLEGSCVPGPARVGDPAGEQGGNSVSQQPLGPPRGL